METKSAITLTYFMLFRVEKYRGNGDNNGNSDFIENFLFLAVAGLCLVEYRDRELVSIDLEKQANKTIYKCALNTSKVIHWYNSLGTSMILHQVEFI